MIRELNHRALLPAWFLLLFAVCFGLGYPTLARYDPRSVAGLSDTVQYFRIVEQSPAAAAGHFKYRVLVPYLAKPIYLLAQGRLGSWNATAFALLIVNSIFCAGTALLVSVLAYSLSRNASLGTLVAFAYLLNFTVSNFQLGGLVDSADAFWFALLTCALLSRQWALLPLIGLLAGLTKETFTPLGFTFAAVWVLASQPREKAAQKIGAVIAMGAVGLLTVLAVRSAIDHRWALPWNIVAEEHAGGFVRNLLHGLTEWNLWLTMILLPFVFLAAKRIPMEWRRAALCAAITTVVLSAWNDAGREASRPFASAGNVGRPLFSIIGPLLAVSFALALDSMQAVRSSVREDGSP